MQAFVSWSLRGVPITILSPMAKLGRNLYLREEEQVTGRHRVGSRYNRRNLIQGLGSEVSRALPGWEVSLNIPGPLGKLGQGQAVPAWPQPTPNPPWLLLPGVLELP